MNIASFIGGRTVVIYHSDGTVTDEVLVVHADGLGVYGSLDASRVFYPFTTISYVEVVK